MNTLEKIFGQEPFFVVGATEAPMPVGYAGNCIKPRIDGTIIASADFLIDVAAVTTTDKSWQGVALLTTDYIPLEYPIVSITLTGASDSVAVYLEGTTWTAPEE